MERRRIEPWRLLSSIYSFSDRWLKLRSDTVRLPGGSTLTPYHVIEAADWVNVVAISDTGCIVLVEQYRHAVTRTMLEIPAGHIDPDETPETAARRLALQQPGAQFPGARRDEGRRARPGGEREPPLARDSLGGVRRRFARRDDAVARGQPDVESVAGPSAGRQHRRSRNTAPEAMS